MKCPGCRAEIAEGSQYCNSCGGRIIESGIDYSQMGRGTSVFDETGTHESPESDWVEKYDEHLANVGVGRFIGALVGTPIAAFLCLMSGLDQGNPYLLGAGVIFACLSIVLIAIYIRVYGGGTSRGNKDHTASLHRFNRRI